MVFAKSVNNRLVLLLVCVLLAAVSAKSVYAETQVIGSFGRDGLSGWEPKVFKGKTDYRLVVDEGRSVIKAISKGAGSGLVKKVKYDPAVFRYLKWSWKVEGPVSGGDERTKAGDDYAARVYVIFSGRYFWQTRAINYIWGNRLKKDAVIANAFTGNAMMIAVQSGGEHAGKWLAEERDILSDYRRLFGAEPGEIGAVAIMTDTDNTGSSATAWYGDISISTAR